MLNPILFGGEWEGVRHKICVIKVQKAMASEYVKAECDNFALKQETFDAQPY